MTPTIESYPGPDDRDGVLVRTPYDEDFVADLKNAVPSADRRWWPDMRKAWWVDDAYRSHVIRLLLFHFEQFAEDDDVGNRVITTADGDRVLQEGIF